MAAFLFLILFVLPGAAHAVDVPVTPAPTPTPVDNDYTRIKNAVAAAGAGDRIILTGTFNWTETNAATSWALGNDGLPANADDYSIVLPLINDVEVTASSPGAATIQGPGDLAAQNLEGVFVADGGDTKEWTFSDLRILDFDLALGFFNGAGGADAFEKTTITDNFIRIPADLNSTAAPADVNQNIGIHFSYGKSQTISGNTIEIAGNGVSNAPSNFASSVGMQSNTSGGNIYDGLMIASNEIRILNAQAANPESIIGIWDQCIAHTSNISILDNTFENLAAANNPLLNLQRAFRVTSHSSATTSVTYEGNEVDGPNRGFEWLASNNFSGNKPVRLIGNRVEGAATGILIQSLGVAHLSGNEITGSLHEENAGAGVSVLSGRLEGLSPSTPAATENEISGGAGRGIWIQSPNGTVVGPVRGNALSANAGFGFDNDSLGAADVRFNWWGSSEPEVVYPEISAVAGSDPRPWLLEATDIEPGVRGFQGETARIALDGGIEAGDAADDSFELTALGLDTVVSQAGTPVVTGQFSAVGIYGSSDRDEVVVKSTPAPVSADLLLLRGGEDDDLIFDDSAQTAAESYTVKPGSVERAGLGAGDAIFNGATEEVEIRGGSGADGFDVTPAPQTTFKLHGNAPTTAPGDLLSYRTEGRETTRTPGSGPDGEYSAAGVAKVLFTGMESVELIAPPIVPNPGADAAPVLSDLRLSRARIARKGKRPRPVPDILFTLSEAASVEIVIERRIKGRRVGARCSPKAKKGPRCATYRKAATSTIAGKAGANQASLPARVRTLPRGSYRVTAVATDSAGQKSPGSSVTLTIKR